MIIITIIMIYLAISFKDPFWLLILVPIGSYLGYLFQIFKNATIPFSLFQIFLILFMLIFFYHRLHTGNFKLKVSGFELEFLLFFGIIYLSLIYSPNRGEGLLYAMRILVLIIMLYLIINSITNLRQIRILLYTIACISIILALFSIKEGLMQPEALIWNFVSMGRKLEARATVIQTDPNIFASHYFLPIFLVVSIFISIDLKKKWRFLALVLFIIYFAGVISTFSRSAWVSIFMGLFFLILLRKQYKMIFLLLLTGTVALFVFPYSKIIISNILTRLIDIFAGTGEASSRVRLILAMGALHMIFDSYLLGIGFRGFPIVFKQYEYSKYTLAVYEPHSVFYAIFAELGLFGFLLYTWIIWKMGYYALQNYRASTTENEKIISGTLFISFVTYIIFYEFYGGGLVDNNLWLIISLILSFRYLVKGKEDRKVYISLSKF